LRTHEVGQLLAVALGILTSLALDRSQLLLEPTHFVVFRIVVLLGLSSRVFEISETLVDRGSRAVRVLDVRSPLSLEIHDAVIVRPA
jgi:hypothetical protein